MDLESFEALMRTYARVPQTRLYYNVIRLAHVVFAFCRDGVIASLNRYPDAPCVFTHMADGWGVNIPQLVTSAAFGPSLTLTRKCKLRQEFFLNRGMFRQQRGDKH